MENFHDFMIGINLNRRAIAKRLHVLLMAALQIGGGIILMDTDLTRGTPLLIERSGFMRMDTFSMVMLAAGVITLLIGVFRLHAVNVKVMAVLTLPFALYIGYTLEGVFLGLLSGQAALIYSVFYLIVMVTVWAFD